MAKAAIHRYHPATAAFIAYVPHVSCKHAGKIVLYGLWADEVTHAAHVQGSNLSRLRTLFDELLAEPLRAERLHRLGEAD
jgi:quinol monooxygenase YgiN